MIRTLIVSIRVIAITVVREKFDLFARELRDFSFRSANSYDERRSPESPPIGTDCMSRTVIHD